jgi:hypothetical protein
MTDFETVLRRFDEGFRVELIAQKLMVFPRDQPMSEILAAARSQNHTYAFIGRHRSDESMWVDRWVNIETGEEAIVGPGDLVSADMPISDLIEKMVRRPFVLVLTGDRVKSLVTRADLNLMPVRMMLFTVIAQVEMLMGDAIERVYPDDSWIERLSERQRSEVERLHALKCDNDNETRRIHCTSLGQKGTVFEKTEELWRLLGCESKKAYVDKRKAFQRLRDKLHHGLDVVSDGGEDQPEDGLRDAIAHNRRYIGDLEGMEALNEVLEALHAWIDQLTSQAHVRVGIRSPD